MSDLLTEGYGHAEATADAETVGDYCLSGNPHGVTADAAYDANRRRTAYIESLEARLSTPTDEVVEALDWLSLNAESGEEFRRIATLRTALTGITTERDQDLAWAAALARENLALQAELQRIRDAGTTLLQSCKEAASCGCAITECTCGWMDAQKQMQAALTPSTCPTTEAFADRDFPDEDEATCPTCHGEKGEPEILYFTVSPNSGWEFPTYCADTFHTTPSPTEEER